MRQNLMKYKLWSFFSAFLLLIAPMQSMAAGLIRDAEIERYLKDLARPVYEAAGLSSSQVRMFIVQDDAINAFVAGGANMFLHTGLITETTTPEMLLGVIAHETGHIAGGHLLRGQELASQAQVGAILTYILGAAAIAGGGADAGAAIISAGSHTATRQFLSYTRTNERSADQAALSYLDRMQISPEGMVLMFERLRREEKRHIGRNADAYARTHPLSQERIEHIRSHLDNSPNKNKKLAASIQQKHARIRAKLIGFLDKDGQVFTQYPESDNSVSAHIARAVAYSATSKRNKALAEIRTALTKDANDAYLHELYGHILFENGDIAPAVNAYRKATQLAPDEALIRSDFARALLALGRDKSDALATQELVQSSKTDPTYHQTWRLLAQAYGRQNMIGEAELALAELAALNNKHEDITLHIESAEQHLDAYSEASIRLDDLRGFAKTLKAKEKEDKTIF